MSTESLVEEAAAVMDVEEIIRELDSEKTLFPEAALRKCQRHSEIVAPRLIRAIEEATECVRKGEEPSGQAFWIAPILLWEFKAVEALPALLAAISLPGDGPFSMFGDGITEDLAPMLAAFAGDNPDLLDTLIANPGINEYVRWEAAQCFCHLVRDGRIPRAEAVERLRRNLRAAMDAHDDFSSEFLVYELCYLNPQEAKAEIQEAMDRGLIGELIDDEYVLEALAGGESHSQERLSQLRPTTIDDAVEYMRGWHCFQEPKQPSAPGKAAFFDPPAWSSDLLSTLADGDDPFDDNWTPPAPETIRFDAPRVGRNDPCPCGSGKKFKKCCLRLTAE